jgi:hypothetical protein
LITNCTNLKKTNIKGKVQLKNLNLANKPDTIIDSWYKQLESAQEKLPASDVYAGDHWKVAKSVLDQNIDLWVLSAGYGLIHNSTNIGSYDATFSSGSDNSINKTGISNSEWWDKLHQVRDGKAFKCQSLYSLVSNNIEDVFFVAASPNYLNVIQNELKQLVVDRKLTNKNFFIISSKHNIDEKLTPYFLESNADFCRTINGGKVSLNIRLAKYLLDEFKCRKFDSTIVTNKYNTLKKNTPKQLIKERKKLSDAEITDFILRELSAYKGIKVSASMLLKKLRSANLACEQKRFSRLLTACFNEAI